MDRIDLASFRSVTCSALLEREIVIDNGRLRTSFNPRLTARIKGWFLRPDDTIIANRIRVKNLFFNLLGGEELAERVFKARGISVKDFLVNDRPLTSDMVNWLLYEAQNQPDWCTYPQESPDYCSAHFAQRFRSTAAALEGLGLPKLELSSFRGEADFDPTFSLFCDAEGMSDALHALIKAQEAYRSMSSSPVALNDMWQLQDELEAAKRALERARDALPTGNGKQNGDVEQSYSRSVPDAKRDLYSAVVEDLDRHLQVFSSRIDYLEQSQRFDAISSRPIKYVGLVSAEMGASIIQLLLLNVQCARIDIGWSPAESANYVMQLADLWHQFGVTEFERKFTDPMESVTDETRSDYSKEQILYWFEKSLELWLPWMNFRGSLFAPASWAWAELDALSRLEARIFSHGPIPQSFEFG